jgi:hypothetical protein
MSFTKMEGVEVGNDGSVTVNNFAVAKARLNGKTFTAEM